MPKKKTTEEFIQDAITVHGDKYDYSKVKYKNGRTNVIIICKKHDEFKQTPFGHTQGYGCIKCANTSISNSKKKTIKDCEISANEKGGKCLSTEYINRDTKMKWQCKEGHIWEVAYNNISKSRSWCPECGKLSSGNKRRNNIAECHKIANERGVKCLSIEYINNNTKMKWECGEGHKWETTFTHIKSSQSWCPICSGHSEITIKDCEISANERGGKCLSTEYIVGKKIKWKCEEGHEWEALFSRANPRWCPKCLLCPSCNLWRTYGILCNYCKPKNENRLYQKTKEYAIVKYLKENLPDYDFIHNKSVGNECTKDEKENSNGHLYPDIRFDCDFYHLIVEVDEHKHRGANYKCEEQRMYNIITKLGLPCIFIRYNPDSKESNKDILLNRIQKYLDIDVEQNNPWNDYGFMVEYLFY